MTRHSRKALSGLLALVLVSVVLTTTGAVAAGKPDPGGIAHGRLTDDVPIPGPVRDLRVAGFRGGMRISWSPPATNAEAVATYTAVVQPCEFVQTVPASTTTVSVIVRHHPECGSRYEVFVTPRDGSGRGPVTDSIVAWLGIPAVRAARRGAALAFSGSLATFLRPLVGQVVELQRKTSQGWVTVKTLRTGRHGRFSADLRHHTHAYYRVAFLGGPGLVGMATKPHRW